MLYSKHELILMFKFISFRFLSHSLNLQLNRQLVRNGHSIPTIITIEHSSNSRPLCYVHSMKCLFLFISIVHKSISSSQTKWVTKTETSKKQPSIPLSDESFLRSRCYVHSLNTVILIQLYLRSSNFRYTNVLNHIMNRQLNRQSATDI